jgi:catechol 2,3-dioxygenase-like lactoylglutathione lyase family enzyme
MMVFMDHATPNLASRDYDATFRFYAGLGFRERFRDEGWMILTRGGIDLEFFRHPNLDPETSWFSCCLRLDGLDDFYAICLAANIPEATKGAPRIHKPALEGSGMRMGALIDPDGTLIRLIQN